jgi:electron transport complex protein RnfB
MSACTAPSRAERIDAVLPQQQCRRCGYDACRPYADAVAQGVAINRCAPGGELVILKLAVLTGRPATALDPACGIHVPLAVARVDEAWCIGCVLCIEACPVDAIVGATKRLHTVLPSLCTGCELCIAPCPVDCITLVPAGRTWSTEDARAARDRFDATQRRRAESSAKPAVAVAQATPPTPCPPAADAGRERRKAAIDAALARARARRSAAAPTRR